MKKNDEVRDAVLNSYVIYIIVMYIFFSPFQSAFISLISLFATHPIRFNI